MVIHSHTKERYTNVQTAQFHNPLKKKEMAHEVCS